MSNIITAVFGGARTARTKPIHQWNYGQVLRFVGITLPDAYTVHFSNSAETGTAKTQIGNASGVIVPDEYLTTGQDIYAWVFLHTGDSDGETKYSVIIPVIRRPQPTEEPPTPVQQGLVDQAIAALNAGVEAAEDAAERAEQYNVRVWVDDDAIHLYGGIPGGEGGGNLTAEVQALPIKSMPTANVEDDHLTIGIPTFYPRESEELYYLYSGGRPSDFTAYRKKLVIGDDYRVTITTSDNEDTYQLTAEVDDDSSEYVSVKLGDVDSYGFKITYTKVYRYGEYEEGLAFQFSDELSNITQVKIEHDVGNKIYVGNLPRLTYRKDEDWFSHYPISFLGVLNMFSKLCNAGITFTDIEWD